MAAALHHVFLLFVVIATTTASNLLKYRGLPLSLNHTHYGSKFCIAFPYNEQSLLSLIISTTESIPVAFNVSFNSLETISDQVIDGQPTAITLNSALSISVTDTTLKGISIHTINESQSISVIGISTGNSGQDVFLALPITTFPGISRYQYAQFSSSIEDTSSLDFSMFVMVTCERNGIVPFVQAPPSLSKLASVRDIYRLFLDSRETVEDRPTPLRRMKQFETFHFENSTFDMTGLFAWSNLPFGFMASHSCVVTNNNKSCNHLLEQIPPSYTWGYLFHTLPFKGRNSDYIIKILPRYDNTTLNWTCGNNSTITLSDLLTVEGISIDILAQSACSFEADRPVAVVQYAKGPLNDTVDSTMVWIAPVSQHLSRHAFSTELFSISFTHYISVTVLARYFDPSAILLDGTPLETNTTEWSTIDCSQNGPCGYGISKRVSIGTHIVQHTNPNASINVIVYGWQIEKGYAYPAGFGMNPIGVPAISFGQSLFNGSESNVNVTITCLRSGDIFREVEIKVEIRALGTDSASNDFLATEEIVYFDYGQTTSNVTFIVQDDLRVEPLETFQLVLKPNNDKDVVFLVMQAELFIEDNDELVIEFDKPSYTVLEESDEVTLLLRSNIPLQDSGVSIFISTEDGTALETMDYDRRNRDLESLLPGTSSWQIKIKIQNDNNVETTEYFFVRFEVSSATVPVKRRNERVQVNITDQDSITVQFSSISLNFPERNEGIVTITKTGENIIPLDVLVTSSDITALAYVDYVPIKEVRITFAFGQSVKSLNVTILQDNFLEGDEMFFLNLTATQEYSNHILLGSNPYTVVTIEDDDAVTVGFTRETYTVDENERSVTITIELNSGMPFRSFLIHFETFEQQAKEDKDYFPIDKDFVFPANKSFIVVSINITNDDIAEMVSEGFTVSLSASLMDSIFVKLNDSRQQATVTINEDDRVLVVMNPISYSGREGDDPVMIKLIKTGVADTSVIVVLGAVGGTAIEGTDFESLSGSVIFSRNETTKFYPLRILVDSEVEVTETVEIILYPLSGPVNVDLNQVATVTIFDLNVAVIGFSAANYSIGEGQSVQVIVTVVGTLVNTTTIIINTVSGTAGETDFNSIMNEVIVLPVNTSKYVINIDIKEDIIFEKTESFRVTLNLEEGSQTVLGKISSTEINIFDNDNVTLTLTGREVLVREKEKKIILMVEKFGQAEIDIPISFLPIDGSAKRGSDYIAVLKSDFITSNMSFLNVSFLLVDDDIVEDEREDFLVVMFVTANYNILTEVNTTKIIILDDDFVEVYFDPLVYNISEDIPNGEVTVKWEGQFAIPLSVQIMTIKDTANANEDFQPFSEEIELKSDANSKTLPFIVNGDFIYETVEIFYIVFNVTSNRIMIRNGSERVTVRILDGNAATLIVVLSSNDRTFYESDVEAQITIEVTGVREASIPFNFFTHDGSAKAGLDYHRITRLFEINIADQNKIVNVPLINDNSSEVAETFFAEFSFDDSRILSLLGNVSVTILDDEAVIISFEKLSYELKENETLSIKVLQIGAVIGNAEVVVTSHDLQALSNRDYKEISTTIQFSPQITERVIVVEALRDVFFEDVEMFSIQLSLPNPDTQRGVVISEKEAHVNITDQNILVLRGDNVVTSEDEGNVEVCLQVLTVNTFDVELYSMFVTPLLDPATNGVDFNDTAQLVTLIRGMPSICFNISVFPDNEEEPEEHICVSLIHPLSGRVQLSSTSLTQYCPLSAITVTISAADRSMRHLCAVEDSMVVTPFPKPLASSSSYCYHGNCERIVLRECNLTSSFVVTADHNPNNLMLSRVGIRVRASVVLISEDLNVMVDNQGSQNDIVVSQTNDTVSQTVSVSINSLGLDIAITYNKVLANKTLLVNATNYNGKTVCGLCGMLDGTLVYSDGKTQVTARDKNVITTFAKSWLVNPGEHIVGEDRQECGILGNDSIVGDPLFAIPLYLFNTSLHDVSLCFEIHGAIGKTFNLISDRCVSVNALYDAMNNSLDANIITSIGVKAVDDQGQCINIIVSAKDQCNPQINGVQALRYDQSGIIVAKHMSRVRLSVPNCESEQLVMWVLCEDINGQKMIDFVVSRGINLSPSSHGLVGQFWNIPVTAHNYHTELRDDIKDDYDPDKLYLVKVTPPSGHTIRQFIGELYHRSWDRTLKYCIYAGSSQGGRSIDIAGPRDSVIEGVYTDYDVTDGLVGTNFKYSQFDTSLC